MKKQDVKWESNQTLGITGNILSLLKYPGIINQELMKEKETRFRIWELKTRSQTQKKQFHLAKN